jgi:hypothetical protein
MSPPHICDYRTRLYYGVKKRPAAIPLEHDRHTDDPSIFVPTSPTNLPITQQFLSSFHQLLFHPLRLSHANIIAEFRAQSGFHDQSRALR